MGIVGKLAPAEATNNVVQFPTPETQKLSTAGEGIVTGVQEKAEAIKVPVTLMLNKEQYAVVAGVLFPANSNIAPTGANDNNADRVTETVDDQLIA